MNGSDGSALRHLAWLPAAALVGFGASYLFSDLLVLPVDLYHAVYFALVAGFLAIYALRTGLDVGAWCSRRLRRGLLLGLLGGLVLLQGVLARPGSAEPSRAGLWADVMWRGVVYGAVDGLLLFAFPWIVVWRALDAEGAGDGRKAVAGALAWLAVLFVTTAYHLGYVDFRSRKILQPNIGATIGAVPTLVTANPVASPVGHVVMHVAAVLHDPGSELYLPPHRRRDGAADARPSVSGGEGEP